MTRLWTGKGDDGTTGLLYGGRAPKDSPRIDAVGHLDEAQATIGMARALLSEAGDVDAVLTRVQRDLWVLMAEVATDDHRRDALTGGETLVTSEMVEQLEATITSVSARFELPTTFVVPGQDPGSASLDLARTVVRRAERAAVAVGLPADSSVLAYLNRLSTLLWTLARWVEGEPLLTKTR